MGLRDDKRPADVVRERPSETCATPFHLKGRFSSKATTSLAWETGIRSGLTRNES